MGKREDLVKRASEFNDRPEAVETLAETYLDNGNSIAEIKAEGDVIKAENELLEQRILLVLQKYPEKVPGLTFDEGYMSAGMKRRTTALKPEDWVKGAMEWFKVDLAQAQAFSDHVNGGKVTSSTPKLKLSKKRGRGAQSTMLPPEVIAEAAEAVAAARGAPAGVASVLGKRSSAGSAGPRRL